MTARRSLLPLVVLLAGSGLLAAQAPASVSQAISRIENGLLPPVLIKGRPLEPKRLADRMRELKVPGVSVAVFRNGRIEWTRAWGVADATTGRRIDRDTRFQAASISKPVAAAAVLALVSRGRLSLDAGVNDQLTSWKLPANEHTVAEPVSLRRLLTHSAGTTVHGFRGYARGEEVPTLVQLLDGVKPANSAPVRVDIPVGSRWRYSGGGISIAQLVVEDETRKPFAQAARELVLQPLGVGFRDHASGVVVMTNSDAGSPLANEIVRTVAHEYGFPGLGPVERVPGTADPAAYPDFAGRYEMEGRTPPFLQVVAEGGRLFRTTGPRPDQRSELLPESAHTFFAVDADLRIEFVRAAGGCVTEARVMQGGTEVRAPKQVERR